MPLAPSRAALATCAVWLPLACSAAPGVDPELAARLHSDAIVIDTHSDTTPYFQDPNWDFEQRHGALETHMDWPRIREGGLDAQFWAIYMPAVEGEGRAIRRALERIDAVHALAASHPDIELATTAEDVRRIAKQGRFASLMGMEGGHIIEDSLAALRSYHRLGVRYLTLTHSFHTNWADSAGTVEIPAPLHGGLAPFGEEIVREMNRLGMLVDVSHVSDDTFWDALRVSEAPLIASHSGCRSVADHVRNLDDAMLRGLAENGGVLMINFYPAYLDEQTAARTTEYYARWKPTLEALVEPHAGDWVGSWAARRGHYAQHPLPTVSLDRLLDHFDHAIAVAGPDHVGIGADWDGVASMPSGMEDVSRLPALTLGLLERGHPPEVVRKVLGENLLRAMTDVERIARRIGRAPD